MNAVELKNVSKIYKDFTLDNLTLTLPNGCIMGLVGENGAGKSTTIKLILGMIHKNSGSVSVLGHEVDENFNDVKNEIGVVLDEVSFPETITVKQLNNVMKYTYRNWDEKSYFSYAENFSLSENKKFKDFSKGMKMKLAIAVALSHAAKLLILDEATAGLDPIIRDEILDILNEFTRDEHHSVLISSHITSDLEKICDYIAFIHKGKLLMCEEKDVLIDRFAIFKCGKDSFSEIDSSAVIGKRETRYGVETLIDREKLPRSFQADRASLEDIFVFLTKHHN